MFTKFKKTTPKMHDKHKLHSNVINYTVIVFYLNIEEFSKGSCKDVSILCVMVVRFYLAVFNFVIVVLSCVEVHDEGVLINYDKLL